MGGPRCGQRSGGRCGVRVSWRALRRRGRRAAGLDRGSEPGLWALLLEGYHRSGSYGGITQRNHRRRYFAVIAFRATPGRCFAPLTTSIARVILGQVLGALSASTAFFVYELLINSASKPQFFSRAVEPRRPISLFGRAHFDDFRRHRRRAMENPPTKGANSHHEIGRALDDGNGRAECWLMCLLAAWPLERWARYASAEPVGLWARSLTPRRLAERPFSFITARAWAPKSAG